MSASGKSLKRKRSKKYYCSQSSKKKKIEDLSPGLQGFLFTANDRKEALVVNEAYALLNEYADNLYGPEKIDSEGDQSENEDEIEDQSIEDALKKEITEIKNRKFKERRFKAVKTKVKNVIFVKTTLNEPNRLTDAIFEDLEKTKLLKTRRCLKCFPIMLTCYASEKAILKEIDKFFSCFFELERTSATYRIDFKARCNNSLKRDDFIREIGETIEYYNEEWKVQYQDPDYVVSVQIVTNICAFGLLKNFKRFRNYNLQAFGIQNSNKIDTEENKLSEKETDCQKQLSLETSSILVKHVQDEGAGETEDSVLKKEPSLSNDTILTNAAMTSSEKDVTFSQETVKFTSENIEIAEKILSSEETISENDNEKN